METLKSEFFKLNLNDLLHGAVVAVLAIFLGMLQQGLAAHGFHFSAYDWHSILDVSLEAGWAYVLKNLLSTTDGKVLGKI